MSARQPFSIGARLASFTHAFRGIRELLQSQHNAWLHAMATLMVFVAGAGFRLSVSEWIAIVLSMVMVWTAEAFNTALEFLTDLISPEIHPLARKAKDVAAGSVLISAIGAAIIGALVFIPHVRVLMMK